MAATAGRIVCGRCNANNFATQASCWKCGTPLSAAAPPASVPPAAPRPMATPAVAMNAPVHRPLPDSQPDPAIAVWAAIALALLFPYIAVPVGIVFLMLDDRRKMEIGRTTLIWGIVATVVHTLITGWLISATVQQGLGLLQGVARARAAASGRGDNSLSIPGLSTTPNARSLPRLPTVPDYENVPFPEVPQNTTAPK